MCRFSAFARAVLSQYRIETGSTADGVEALFDLVAGYPLRSFGPKVVFVIDAAQEIKAAVLETLRALWDRGTHARLGMTTGPAFGLILVGNDTFTGKGGNLRVAGFRPLLSRVTHNVQLPRPSRAEHAAFSAALFPSSPELQALFTGFGKDHGNLQAQDVAARQARLIAGAGEVTAAHVRQAIKLMGGQVMKIVHVRADFSDAMAEICAHPDAATMVVPMLGDEIEPLGQSLNAVNDFLHLNRRCLQTSKQVLDTRVANEEDIRKTLEQLIEPATRSVELHDMVRKVLGRATFAGKHQTKGKPQ